MYVYISHVVEYAGVPVVGGALIGTQLFNAAWSPYGLAFAGIGMLCSQSVVWTYATFLEAMRRVARILVESMVWSGGRELGLSLSKRDGGTYPSRSSNLVVFALLFEMLFALSTIPHI